MFVTREELFCWMLLLSGAAGTAWLLAAEPVIRAAASAATMRLVFIAYLLFCSDLFAETPLRKGAVAGEGPAPSDGATARGCR
jgi:hypothetical protein